MPLSIRPLTLSLLVALSLGTLSACDQERVAKLEEGVATESDVRQQFGEPKRIIERADGSKVLEYPRQPEGVTNYVIEIGPDGKMSSLRQLLHPANFAKVQPGMTDQDVRQLLGQPAKTHRFDLKPDETIWDWRFQDGQQRKVFSVTFGKDNTVIATGTQDDPRELDTGR
ncbi:MAG: outer membrane protein assembly factor BamE [Ideonella sp. MAG2]|nr:MAG: outer membrane protein assembly factor BamE [Ideonella sp. MAG2]